MTGLLPPISLLAQTHSTNDVATRAARSGADHGACWVADQQSAGRGRRQIDGVRRAWFSPPGANLYMSLLLKPRLEPSMLATLTLAAAVGARQALAEASGLGDKIWIKWPNDLYIGDKKLAGLLSEGVLDGMKIVGAVVGIGVNVNLGDDELPDEIASIATSLKIATGQSHDRFSLTLRIREHIMARSRQLEQLGLATILEDFRPHDLSVGRAIQVMHAGAWAAGVSRGIADSGGLAVVLDSGERLVVQAGEVRFLPKSS